jgi:hypothetical protein
MITQKGRQRRENVEERWKTYTKRKTEKRKCRKKGGKLTKKEDREKKMWKERWKESDKEMITQNGRKRKGNVKRKMERVRQGNDNTKWKKEKGKCKKKMEK